MNDFTDIDKACDASEGRLGGPIRKQINPTPAYQLGKPRLEVTKAPWTGEGQGGQANCASEMPWQNPRDLIDRRIDKLNRQVNQLHALRRALPSEMLPEAERALVTILEAAQLGGW